MKTIKFMLKFFLLSILIVLCNLEENYAASQNMSNNSVKVFILAGQSNMEGKGVVEMKQKYIDKNGGKGTLRYLVDNDDNSKYKHLVDSSGDWSERDDVWLVDIDNSGPLKVESKIGPDLQFGHVVGDFFKNSQVLLIKTAWGGKSLYEHFRPPSSGGTVGEYYIEMINRVHEVLNDIESFYPDYEGQGYEIVGFGWHQGWNDRVNKDAVAEYQVNCVNLINDLRDEFNLPDMPFVLATTGMGGWSEDLSEKALALMNAQLAVPGDSGLNVSKNVAAVETRGYWRESDESPSGFGFHWNLNAETYFLIGKGMGNAMTALLPAEEDNDNDENAVIYEAEDYTKTNGCIFKSRKTGFTGTGYMDYGGNGTWIKWDNINISNAGEYTLKFRYSNGGSKRQCAIIKNGQNVGNVAFKNTGGGRIWKTDSIVVQLKKGINKIKVKANTANGGPNLDHMEILGSGGSVTDTDSENTEISSELLNAITAIQYHLDGTLTLSDTVLKQHNETINSEIQSQELNKELISMAFNTVESYEIVYGPLFMNSDTEDGWSRDSEENIHTIIMSIMQGIIDYVYTSENLSKYKTLLDGFYFESSKYFPGEVTSTPNPDKVHSVTINGSYEKTFGHLIMHAERPARKPTGTYLAPGTIATVTVPRELVGQGYQIIVGAHSSDLSNKPRIKRLDRSSIVYDINSTTTEIASPLGGGIYIEVPYLADAGIVNVSIQNAVRSPYFSMKSFHTTTVDEWQTVERRHGAPWADFQTEKFMMQVPTSQIYNFDDPETLLEDWDRAMDAVSTLMGYPLIRGKEVLYLQADVIIKAKAYSPGYPQVNTVYKPHKEYDGNHDSHLLNGIIDNWKFQSIEFHELGHGHKFQKFPKETESAVNLLYVAVLNKKFGFSLDEAFDKSFKSGNGFRTLDNTAVKCMMTETFYNNDPMTYTEKKYQHRGYAEYVDVVRLFGWRVLEKYWKSINNNYENTVSPDNTDTDEKGDYDDSVNGLILRMSKKAKVDLTPLIHFWGTHPDDIEALKNDIADKNLPPSPEIYDTLVRYKEIIPADNDAYLAFIDNWNGGDEPNEGTYDAELWTIWDESYASVVRNNVQKIIDLYFPDGRP